MKAWMFCVLLLSLSSEAMAFTTKKLDPMATRPAHAFKATASLGSSSKERDESLPLPMVSGSTPAFALPHPATHKGVSMAPAVYIEEDEEDDELFSYGTALVSCVASLALGFTLGYGT